MPVQLYMKKGKQRTEMPTLREKCWKKRDGAKRVSQKPGKRPLESVTSAAALMMKAGEKIEVQFHTWCNALEQRGSVPRLCSQPSDEKRSNKREDPIHKHKKL